jgi:glycine/D-amino acid oxidase-like deaminating enzyme
MKIIVLGAGVIGTTAAYCLALRGHDVTVVDRRPGPWSGTPCRRQLPELALRYDEHTWKRHTR